MHQKILTHEECSNFLKVHLKFPDWEKILNSDKIKFLELFTRQHLIEIGYQNVSSARVNLTDRDCPSAEQMIKTGLSGIGGMCIELNYFAKTLLQSLGFDAFLIAASANSVAVPNNHSITVVRISPNEMYLIDVGMAQPVGHPIPLHKLPYGGQMLGYPYEYRWLEEEKEFARIHIKGKVSAGEFKDKVEDKFMTFTLEPRDYDYFYPWMAFIYKDCDRFNLRGLFLAKYFADEEQVDKNLKDRISYVMVFGKHIYSGNKDVRNVMDFKCYEDMVPEVKKYFPKLCEKEMREAFVNFRI